MNNTRWSLETGKDVAAKTSQEALSLGGLEFNVLQAPVQFTIDGQAMTDKGHMVNYRSDTKDVLGLVSDTYKVLQNKDAFRFLDSVVGVAEAMYVNVGSFRNGSRVYIQAKLQDKMTFDDNGEDIGEKYLTFITSHDGSLPVSVKFTPVRIICQNTLLMALKDTFRGTNVRHTLNMIDSLNEARKTLGIWNTQFTLMETLSKKLTHVQFDAKNMEQLLIKSGMIPNEPIDDRSTRAKNILDEVIQRYETGKGAELKSAKGTAWGAYNAVVEYVDHFRGKDAAKRAESSILGSGSQIKEKALSLLATI